MRMNWAVAGVGAALISFEISKFRQLRVATCGMTKGLVNYSPKGRVGTVATAPHL